MLALSPPVFPSYGWPLEDPIPHQQIYFSREADKTIANTHLFQPQPPQILELDHHSASFTDYSGDLNMVKKLNHNASERYRRKKMNSLYSSLRSLLPAADQMKKLSIAATVSKVLKYIPELQEKVERLNQRKEELFSKLDHRCQQKQLKHRKSITRSSLSAVSATQLSDSEVVIQISTFGVRTTSLSEILLHLEEEGLSLINSSCFESFGGRVFLNLHLQVEGSYRLERQALSEKLVSLYEEGCFHEIHNIS